MPYCLLICGVSSTKQSNRYNYILNFKRVITPILFTHLTIYVFSFRFVSCQEGQRNSLKGGCHEIFDVQNLRVHLSRHRLIRFKRRLFYDPLNSYKLRRRLVLDQRCSPRYIHIHNLKTMLKVFLFCFSYSISLQTFGNFILHFKALTGRFVVISLIKNCPVTS